MEYLKELPTEELCAEVMEYINYTIDLLRDGDPKHFLKSCFDARFEAPEKIQELIESKQFGALVLRSFKYISDLVVNVNMAFPSFKIGLSSVRSNDK